MDYNVQQLDALCLRLERSADQLCHSGGATIELQQDEQLASDLVQTIQRIGEYIAWAYGQQQRCQRQGLGELFAQPFVDRRSRERLKALLYETVQRPPAKSSAPVERTRAIRNRIAAQILQTIHILLQATPPDSTLFCNLSAGWYLNDLVSAPIDVWEGEDLLPLWMTVIKDIATMLSSDNMMLFFNPTADNSFPIFTEAVRFYHHPTAQVRTHVQAISLEIFLRLRANDKWNEPIFQTVLAESKSFFTHVCCLLRDFWKMVDDAVSKGSKRDARSALAIQNDIAMYISDVISCEIPRLNEVLQEKLLRFALLPVLLRAVLPPPQEADGPSSKAQQTHHLLPATALYLMGDLLHTLKGSSVLNVVANTLLRQEVPEDVINLVLGPPSTTPESYLEVQRVWSGSGDVDISTIGLAIGRSAATNVDQALYAMPATTLLQVLDCKPAQAAPTVRLVHNTILDSLEARLESIVSAPSLRENAVPLLGILAMMLQILRRARGSVAAPVGERLAHLLCGVLASYRRLRWPTLEAALAALRELGSAPEKVAGTLPTTVARLMRDKVLRVLAAELLQEVRGATGASSALREECIREFQEQWHAHLAKAPESSPASRQREFLDPPLSAQAHLPEGRSLGFRVLLCARHLRAELLATADDATMVEDDRMPGVCDVELEELGRFVPGTPVQIGKMNRLKVQVRANSRLPSSELEATYLLPSTSSLIIVRPDEHKPFWAVPVIVEPLRFVHVDVGDENDVSANGIPTSIHLEVVAPRSPFLTSLAGAAAAVANSPPVKSPLVLGSVSNGAYPLDRMANSVGAVPIARRPGIAEKVASMVPPVVGYSSERSNIGTSALPAEQREATTCSFSLGFSDDRRRRVACKLLLQAQYATLCGVGEGVQSFLSRLCGH